MGAFSGDQLPKSIAARGFDVAFRRTLRPPQPLALLILELLEELGDRRIAERALQIRQGFRLAAIGRGQLELADALDLALEGNVPVTRQRH